MLSASSGRRAPRSAPNPLVSLRSPLPLMVAGIGVTLLVIAVATLPFRPPPEAPQQASLSDAEALTIVANEMRSGAAAARVINEGQTRFDDGTWYISLDGAHFHFSQRNRIVVAEDPPAIQLEYGS